MAKWGNGWGNQWGIPTIEVAAGEALTVSDAATPTLIFDPSIIRVGSTRTFTTIQAALAVFSQAMTELGLAEFDRRRTILLDPEVFFENVVFPANLNPTAAAPLLIQCDNGISPKDVIVDGGGTAPCFTIQIPHVRIECLTVRDGDPVGIRLIAPASKVRLERLVVRDNAEVGIRSEAGVLSPKIANCVAFGNPKRGVEIESNLGICRLIYLSVLQSAGTIPAPSAAVRVDETNFSLVNSILLAQGAGAVSRCLDISHSGAVPFTSDFNNLFRPEAGPLVQLDEGGGPVDFADLAAWQAAAPAQDAASISDDPDFLDTDAGEVRLRLRLRTPSHRAGTFVPDVLIDLFGSTRPQDEPSQGAIEPLNVILEQGEQRFLELLAGISTDAVDRSLAGVAGTLAALPEIFDPEATDRLLAQLDTEVFEALIPIERVSVEGSKAIFGVRLGPSIGLLKTRLDEVVDPLSEIGLAFRDRLLFTRLTLREIPLEPLAQVTTIVDIGIEIV